MDTPKINPMAGIGVALVADLKIPTSNARMAAGRERLSSQRPGFESSKS